LIGAGLQSHASSVSCRHLSDEAYFLYKFRDRNFLFASMHGLAVRLETLTAEALRYDYYLAKYNEGILELPGRRGLQFVIDETAKTNPKGAGQTPESLKLLEPAVLDELKRAVLWSAQKNKPRLTHDERTTTRDDRGASRRRKQDSATIRGKPRP
jgi:hypothetical protein